MLVKPALFTLLVLDIENPHVYVRRQCFLFSLSNKTAFEVAGTRIKTGSKVTTDKLLWSQCCLGERFIQNTYRFKRGNQNLC